MEILKYRYRKLFGLTAAELREEPIDEFFTNLVIHGYITKKKQDEMNHGNSRT